MWFHLLCAALCNASLLLCMQPWYNKQPSALSSFVFFLVFIIYLLFVLMLVGFVVLLVCSVTKLALTALWLCFLIYQDLPNTRRKGISTRKLLPYIRHVTQSKKKHSHCTGNFFILLLGIFKRIVSVMGGADRDIKLLLTHHTRIPSLRLCAGVPKIFSTTATATLYVPTAFATYAGS